MQKMARIAIGNSHLPTLIGCTEKKAHKHSTESELFIQIYTKLMWCDAMLTWILFYAVVDARANDQMAVRLNQWVWMSAPKHVNTVCALSNMECKWNAGIQQLYFYIFRLSSPVEMVLCVCAATQETQNEKLKLKKKMKEKHSGKK